VCVSGVEILVRGRRIEAKARDRITQQIEPLVALVSSLEQARRAFLGLQAEVKRRNSFLR
jgi:hypothetical protein